MSLMLFSFITNAQDTLKVPTNNEINLRLNGLEKFGIQHRTGNRLIITGIVLNGFGLVFMNTTNNNPYSKLNDTKIGTGLIIAGSALTTTGLVINLDSFKHLRKTKRVNVKFR